MFHPFAQYIEPVFWYCVCRLKTFRQAFSCSRPWKLDQTISLFLVRELGCNPLWCTQHQVIIMCVDHLNFMIFYATTKQETSFSVFIFCFQSPTNHNDSDMWLSHGMNSILQWSCAFWQVFPPLLLRNIAPFQPFELHSLEFSLHNIELYFNRSHFIISYKYLVILKRVIMQYCQ